MKLWKFAAVALMTMASTQLVQAKDWKTVTITLEGTYVPWNSTAADGSLTGFEPELAKYLCDHMNVECKLVASDWSGMIPALNAGKFDVIMDSLSVTEERKKIIDFSIPYANSNVAFATLKENDIADTAGTGSVLKLAPNPKDIPEIEALKAAFKGKTIGIHAATIYSKFIYDNFGSIATIREYKNNPERDLDLQSGRIDVIFDDVIYLASVGESSNGEIAITGPEIGGTIFGIGQALGIRQADTDLRDKFDDAIKAAIADGTIKKLSLKWFKTDVTP
jgi:octopine/nopaline transport system substrate-binding protein